jgi:hypothetical protein
MRHVLGVLVSVMVVAGACGGGGGDGGIFDASESARATTTVVAEPSPGPVASEFPRPNIEQLECGPLLTFDDIDPVLDTMQWLTFSGGETCTHQTLDDASVFVRIGPGHPTDLIAGGVLEGRPGRAVVGVGAAAAWFSDASTLSVAAEGRFGILVFRVTVGRSDLDDAARLEAARALAAAALPRFPGIDAPPAPPPEDVVVTIEHEPADQANQSYVANLLAREAEGDWTRAEGLIATLRLFVGEATTPQVTPARTIIEQSATGILRMALAYVEASGDTDEAAELERLIGLMLPSDLRAGKATSSLRRSSSLAIARTTSQDPSGECVSVWPEHGDPCFMISSEIVPEFGDKYRIVFPDLDEWEGWTRGPSSPISEAIRKTARFLEGRAGESPQIDVVLGPLNSHSTVVLDQGRCQIVLNKGAQLLRDVDPALLQQAVASVMASCYLEHNFGYSENWELAASYYLSDVVYPAASMETVVFKIPDALGREELLTTLTERSITNMPFFEYAHSARGVAGAIDAYGEIVGGGPAAVGGIDELWHDYAKRLTDGMIIDQAGGHSFGPGAQRFDASPRLRIKADPRPFGLERIQLTVPSGMYACMEYPDASNPDLIVSWRPGLPGGGGAWSTSLPDTLNGTAVFVVTVGEAGGRFDLKVRDVEDNPECEEEEKEKEKENPEPPCGFCDPTSFYYDSVEDWLTAIAEGG